jgi:hypothetical protein
VLTNVLAQHIAQRAERHKAATIVRRVVSISHAPRAYGLAHPLKSAVVRAVIRGIKREHRSAQRRAHPLLPDDLLAVLELLPCTTRGIRDRALILLGFASAMRRSDLVKVGCLGPWLCAGGSGGSAAAQQDRPGGAWRIIAVPFGKTRERLSLCCPATNHCSGD